MSEHERFLLTFDSARGVPVKAERIGESGELTEVDLPSFLQSLTAGPAAPPPQQQIVINIYGGGAQGTPVVEHTAGSPKPPSWMAWSPQDHPGGGKLPYKAPKTEE